MTATRLSTPITRKSAPPPRSRRRVLVAVLAVVALVAAGVWAVFFSSLLAVKTVEVRGAVTVDDATVLAAADITTGAPLARLDIGAVVERVGAIAPIAGVAVVRQWPHTVVLTVTERAPALAVVNGRTVSVYDESGVLFRTGASVPAGVPVLESTGAPTPTQVAAVLTVVRALPDSVSARLTSIRADSLDAITLALDGGAVHVVWGSTERGSRKAEVLTVLLRHPALVYDVSAPDVPTTSGTPEPAAS